MIYHKLFITERRIKKVLEKYEAKMAALEQIKNYLNMVDEKAEVISTATAMELAVLIRELKGKPLTETEHELIIEIITNEN